MSDTFQMVLHDEDGLTITFVVQDGAAKVDLRSTSDIDLSQTEDVIIVLNGQGLEPTVHSPQHATANLGHADEMAQPSQLMIRVHEFFEGWELD
jgi:hypothetical protein